MIRRIPLLAFMAVMILSSCSKQGTEAPNPNTQASGPAAETTPPPQTPAAAEGPHASVRLKNGNSIAGSIVASTKTDMVVAGDDGVEHKIPLDQVKSVEYGEAQAAQTTGARARENSAPKRLARENRTAQDTEQGALTPTPRPSPITTKTYELPAGTDLSVRVDQAIDSETANEGQTFDASVTRDVTDANGDVVIPRGSRAWVVIKSASKGGRFRGASDLVLDLQSVSLNGKRYNINTADITQKGKAGIGANKRTATYTGGGAALGAIIGAIAGGGKGAAIGAGAGAGAGALTQVLTKGRAIKVPSESVLTFRLDRPLRVTAA